MVSPALCAGGVAAIAVLKGASNATGNVIFTETEKGVHVTGTITGLEPSSTHGFHVHEFGDISGEGCLAAGGHYNPFNQTHGAPEDKVRHAGDLGNVVASENGTVVLDITDRQLRLRGARSILGRGVVLHSGVDDLGRGNNTDSKKTGNAGSRLACGAIGIGNATALLAMN